MQTSGSSYRRKSSSQPARTSPSFSTALDRMAEAIDAGSSSSSSSSSSASILPCETLWIANLADKIKKGPMKDALYRLYSSFGSIKGISVTKTKAMRGQAFISFADVAQASAAMRDTQGQLLFGKPIVSTCLLAGRPRAFLPSHLTLPSFLCFFVLALFLLCAARRVRQGQERRGPADTARFPGPAERAETGEGEAKTREGDRCRGVLLFISWG